jgi:hypothetical protein
MYCVAVAHNKSSRRTPRNCAAFNEIRTQVHGGLCLRIGLSLQRGHGIGMIFACEFQSLENLRPLAWQLCRAEFTEVFPQMEVTDFSTLPTRAYFFTFSFSHVEGTRWRGWLKHIATNRKVAGSIPDGVTGIFQWLNPSSRIVALGSTQPLTEMSTRNPSWG